jgi:hypothetical protein
VITAASGDSGYGVAYPASSRYVTAVGGTSLAKIPGTSRGWSESVWGSSQSGGEGLGEGTGSGCSGYEAKPSWQTDSDCTYRSDNDVAADANPKPGVAVYDSFSGIGWIPEGGTSAASPIVAATYALAGTPTPNTYPSSYVYAHTNDLYDITTGSNGLCPDYLCNAGTGYDGPTGWGTPDGVSAFTDFPQWSSWVNEIGAPPPGVASGASPAISSWGPGRLDVFVRGGDSAIWHNSYNGFVWSGWQSLGGDVLGNPTAVSYAPDQIDLFGVGTDGNIYHKFWDGRVWSGWFSDIGAPPPGVASGASPTVSSSGSGQLEVFIRGTDNAIWCDFNDGYGWLGWESLGGDVLGNPAAVSPTPTATSPTGTIDLFGVGTDQNLYEDTWNGSSWSGWVKELSAPPPGVASGASPTVSSWGPGRLDVFIRGGDNAAWHNAWNGSSWSGWESQGGILVSDLAAVSWGSNRIDLIGVGTDQNLYHKVAG